MLVGTGVLNPLYLYPGYSILIVNSERAMKSSITGVLYLWCDR